MPIIPLESTSPNNYFSIPLSLNPDITQTLNKLSFNNLIKSNNQLNQPIQTQSTNQASFINETIQYPAVRNVIDNSTLFVQWKLKIEQFKLLMQMKHNNFGFSW